ncbi:MAG TPA: FAD-dependent oxidoreductase [Opitutales bacterium]|nr:FAD-dependent oxidoreductase [Opitutales bacterium]
MERRHFLKTLALSTPAVLWANQLAQGADLSLSKKEGKSFAADLVIAGGGMGGCAAALAAARNGLTVILTEETEWIGGQLTSQAVPPDEHRAIETHGATATYRELRTRIRDYYRRNYPLTDHAKGQENLNPGQGGVSRLCHEPRVALAVLYEMLAPYLATGRLSILLNHRAVAAETDGDRIKGLVVQDLRNGVSRSLEAPYFIDATELGDLLPMTKTEYVTGAESQKDTGELHAPETAQPDNMQAVTWCFPIEYVDGQDFVGDPPPDYAFWRDYVPELTPPWPGRLLSFTYTSPFTMEPRTLAFDPKTEASGWWTYRRIAWLKNFQPGTYEGSISLINWPQNDYLLGHFMGTEEENAKHFEGARRLSLALFYWLQTEAPRPDGGEGWAGLRLRPELVGTTDGLAMYPYIREARRIRAEFTVLEQHVGAHGRRAELGLPADAPVSAAVFDDSVGVGSYNIDLHPSTGGDNYIDVPSLRFQIPLGALIPQRVENLLAANKNIGTTHITNGCYRLHPVEWNIGESAGALIAFCKQKGLTPSQTRNTETHLRDFQKMLIEDGVELEWPAETS